ncbi:MAG: hypothetical protein ABSE63_13760 [Thermoguttaceae bacterium]|jgi:hypothetical protein
MAVIAKLKKTARPAVLTINGKAEIVIQDAKSYQFLLEKFDSAEAVIGIRKGLSSMKRCEGVLAEQAFEKIRKKITIPRCK